MNGENRFQIEVSKHLYEFAKEGLKAPDQFVQEGKRLAHNVFLKLQGNARRFTVAEARFAGSFGKKTDVLQPDLDLVILVNDCEPPYDKVLDEFEDILLLNERELKIRKGSIVRKTSFSVQFVFCNGIEVDLLPAAYMEPDQVYQIIAKNPEKYYSYSSCLVAKQLKFMTSHDSSFLHCVIRLLKYWFKSLCFKDKNVYGGSTLMELIGVAAAEEEEKRDHKNIVSAFTLAMDWICRLKSIKLAFRQVSENKWVRVPFAQLNNTVFHAELLPTVVGTRDILMRKFFIIEPANPYNDLLADKDPLVIERLMKFASVSRQRISDLMSGSGHYATFNGYRNEVQINIMKLFENQPANLIQEFPLGVTKDLLIGYDYKCSRSQCDMKVRNEDVYKKPEVKHFIEAMNWNLMTVVNSVVYTNSNASTNDVRKSIQGLIKTSLESDLVTASNPNHEVYHITLTIPYHIKDVGYAVVCSLRWK